MTTISHVICSQQCSIDALLEKTIKHMVFLQSVTKHADNLKDSNESKVYTHVNYNYFYLQFITSESSCKPHTIFCLGT
jgi:hypothetical protein